MQALVSPIQKALSVYFKNVEVSVVDCPDLTKYGCAKPGICGKYQYIADVGGVPNLLNPQGHSVTFSLNEVAHACGVSDSYVIGAGGGPFCLINKNSEFICCDDLANDKNRKSIIAKLSNRISPAPRHAAPTPLPNQPPKKYVHIFEFLELDAFKCQLGRIREWLGKRGTCSNAKSKIVILR